MPFGINSVSCKLPFAYTPSIQWLMFKMRGPSASISMSGHSECRLEEVPGLSSWTKLSEKKKT